MISSNFSGVKRHVECVDCHNPHRCRPSITHTVGTNAASDLLKGVSRVEAQYGAAAVDSACVHCSIGRLSGRHSVRI